MMKKYLITVLTVLLIQHLHAQITTSAISGKILSDKKEALIGAIVRATHEPTGTVYSAATNLDGQFNIPNMTPGGPYTIKITYVGYTDQNIGNVYLQLGNTSKFNVDMLEDSKKLEEVVITTPKDLKIGTSTNVSKEQMMTLPTLSRGIADFTRLTPQSSNNSFNGTSYRYNNVAIDGAINNDAIGFSPSLGGQSGTSNMPGSSTRSNPISLDAIEQVQVQIAPYDVKLGNFTGGSINAITRRGTNQVTGSIYGFARNAAITGPANAGDKSAMPNSYYDYQTGFRIGLPLIKNKLFFFTNEEITRRQEPVFYGAGTQNSVISVAQGQAITDSLNSPKFLPTSQFNPTGTFNVGNNVGNFGNYTIYSESNKFFNRLDWNISEKHQLMIRNNIVDSKASNLERSSQEFQFGSYDFVQKNLNISTVAELKSRFSNKFANSLILGYTNITDKRDPTALGSSIFPQIQINNVSSANNTSGGGHILLGTNREAGIFNMKQSTIEITNNLNMYVGKHAFTFGTHNELYTINYGFVNSWNGRFEYNSLSDFYANNPSRMRAFYNNTNNSRDYNLNNPSANFNVNIYSLYAQDEFTVNDRFKLTYGIRADLTQIPTGPSWSATQLGSPNNIDPHYGSTYTHTPLANISSNILGQPQVSPRLGFNWDVKGDQSIILRGGSGLFTGRIPFAWLGYAYYNNGTSFGSFDANGTVPKGTHIPTDPTQFQAFSASNAPGLGLNSPKSKAELDLVDKNFRMPQTWRSNLAVDFKLPGDYKLTLEGIFTQVVTDVKLQQVNIKDSVRYASYDASHQQPIYLKGGTTGSSVNSSYTSVYMLSNTNKGYRYSLTAQVQKTYKFGLDIMAAYTYGQSWDILNGIRNSMESGWQTNQALSPNSPTLSHSNFDIRNRIVASAGYKKIWNDKFTTYASMVFSAQSGSPFTWVNAGGGAKLTNTGAQTELAYIPKDQSEVEFVANNASDTRTAGQIWSDFNTYVSNDSYLSTRRGQFTQRNEGRTPWNVQLDLRLMQDINFYGKSKTGTTEGETVQGRKHTIQITFDIINFTNLINPNWGKVYFVPNTINASVNTGLVYAGHDNVTGKEKYTFNAPTQSPWAIDQLASRWQGQLGLRYLF